MVDELLFSSSSSSERYSTSVNSGFRRRLNDFSSVLSNRLWLNAHTNYQADVLLTFSSHIDDYVLIWFLEQLIQLAPDIYVSVKYHFTTGETKIEKRQTKSELFF